MSMVLVSLSSVSALTIDITLTGNVPYVSPDLSTYLYDPEIGALKTGTGFDYVGFNGYPRADYDNGTYRKPGDGVDEIVAFSFRFNPFKSVTSATLKLGLTPKHRLINTDQLTFADNWTQPNKGYGNDILKKLSVGNYYKKVSFDLTNMDIYRTHLTQDLSHWLLDGDLDVVYGDDAIISYARLIITGESGPIPEPASMLLLGIGIAGLALYGRKKIKSVDNNNIA